MTLRRLFSVALVYVVLLVQGLAPVSASLAAARSLDPLAQGVFCGDLSHPDQVSTEHPGSNEHPGATDQHCTHCLVALSGHALTPPVETVPSVELAESRVAWLLEAFNQIGPVTYGVPQARAPPFDL